MLINVDVFICFFRSVLPWICNSSHLYPLKALWEERTMWWFTKVLLLSKPWFVADCSHHSVSYGLHLQFKKEEDPLLQDCDIVSLTLTLTLTSWYLKNGSFKLYYLRLGICNLLYKQKRYSPLIWTHSAQYALTASKTDLPQASSCYAMQINL